jgi:hypothetical protein
MLGVNTFLMFVKKTSRGPPNSDQLSIHSALTRLRIDLFLREAIEQIDVERSDVVVIDRAKVSLDENPKLAGLASDWHNGYFQRVLLPIPMSRIGKPIHTNRK